MQAHGPIYWLFLIIKNKPVSHAPNRGRKAVHLRPSPRAAIDFVRRLREGVDEAAAGLRRLHMRGAHDRLGGAFIGDHAATWLEALLLW